MNLTVEKPQKKPMNEGIKRGKRTGNPLRVKSKMVSLLCLKPLMRLSMRAIKKDIPADMKQDIMMLKTDMTTNILMMIATNRPLS